MEDEQDLVAAALGSLPPAEVRAGFVARVNARIDAGDGGWLAVADFRLWTLRLAPAVAALALVAALWSVPAQAPSAATATSTSDAAATFSPASSGDWQKDVSGDALLEAALAPRGAGDVR
jgi:hypothetical protein